MRCATLNSACARQRRGVSVSDGKAAPAECNFDLTNTGAGAAGAPTHLTGSGWNGQLRNTLAAVKFGESVAVTVCRTWLRQRHEAASSLRLRRRDHQS